MLTSWLQHPLTRGLDIDDPQTTALRRRIIAEKPFLRSVYRDWYGGIARAIPPGGGRVLELGAGAGFLADYIADLITSDLLPCPNVDAVFDGHALPFADAALRAIVMTNVFHHIAHPRIFLSEAARCVRPGGVIAMVEPWVTSWSRLIYSRMHHEPFEPAATDWDFPASGPLSGANGALPWMVFERDRAQFEQEFPAWRIAGIELLMPMSYLLSGGVSLRNLAPGWSYALVRQMEALAQPWQHYGAMFAQVVLERQFDEFAAA